MMPCSVVPSPSCPAQENLRTWYAIPPMVSLCFSSGGPSEVLMTGTDERTRRTQPSHELLHDSHWGSSRSLAAIRSPLNLSDCCEEEAIVGCTRMWLYVPTIGVHFMLEFAALFPPYTVPGLQGTDNHLTTPAVYRPYAAENNRHVSQLKTPDIQYRPLQSSTSNPAGSTYYSSPSQTQRLVTYAPHPFGDRVHMPQYAPRFPDRCTASEQALSRELNSRC
ncbi:hypothetical protein C8Q80DRAFT_411319 [Daedaleopsis nitida]|nr:hypothetical protein C8Q80DRAFT_411319 [Daedaleopsis nitida]